MVLKEMKDHVLKVQIIGGPHDGQICWIPRMTLTPSSEDVPFKFSRRQFPVALAFAITINKSQGQSVDMVGIDLRSSVFSHGQLYVALSRCTSSEGIHAIFPEGADTVTQNVVWQEVLLAEEDTPEDMQVDD